MSPDPIQSAAFDFTLQVERLYTALMCCAANAAEPGLGGKLLYAGDLNDQGRAVMVAANIAGAASLAASADADAQKQSIRNGVADFLVTTLDEALRILKNEIRKQEPVAVCTSAPPSAIEAEMQERGVVPDLLRPAEAPLQRSGQVLLHWRVTASPAQWLPQLDAVALECLRTDSASSVGRRWLRLAPRYLGRMAHGVRVLRADAGTADEFAARARKLAERGGVGVDVCIDREGEEALLLTHPRGPEST